VKVVLTFLLKNFAGAKKGEDDQLRNPGIIRKFPVSTYRNTARTIGELKKIIVRPAVTNANVFETPFLIW
jgi:hypothetical protein